MITRVTRRDAVKIAAALTAGTALPHIAPTADASPAVDDLRRLRAAGMFYDGPMGSPTREVPIRTSFELHPDGRRALILFDRVVSDPGAYLDVGHEPIGELWLPAVELARIFDGI